MTGWGNLGCLCIGSTGYMKVATSDFLQSRMPARSSAGGPAISTSSLLRKPSRALQCCRAPGVAALELYRLLVFAYLSGNGDLHAKNLAILHDERGEWRVTPAYDLPSSAVYSDRTMALPIGGKIRQQLSWAMLRAL